MIQFVSFGELEIGQNSARLLSDALLAMISYKNWAIIGLAYGPTRGLAECGLTTYSPRAGPKYLPLTLCACGLSKHEVHLRLAVQSW
jgi:hypothetical protein